MLIQEDKVPKSMTSALAWSFAERITAQGISTLVSIILARILDPEHYGIIAIVLIFVDLCNAVVTNGLGKALVQRKDADETDFSSMFWLSIVFSSIFYVVLYFCAPMISKFFGIDSLTDVLRVMGIMIPLTGINSIQQAFVQKRMEFRKFFIATSIGTVVSSAVGIYLAYAGYGVWALVHQNLSRAVINTFILFLICEWKPKVVFSVDRIKTMLPFCWKVLTQSLITTSESTIRSSIIGKVFSSEDLAFYNKGLQFPQLIITNINSSMSKAMFPAISNVQNDMNKVKMMLQRFVKVGMYIITPIMIGFFVVAENFVKVVLTDKWLFCVPYLQIFCLAYLLRPFETACFESILAIGRSDVTLKNMIIIEVVAVLTVLVAVFTFKSAILIAFGCIISTIVSVALYSMNANKLIGYKLTEQLRDCSPSLFMSIIMGVCVYFVNFLGLGNLATLFLQVIVGLIVYAGLSHILRNESYMYLLKKTTEH